MGIYYVQIKADAMDKNIECPYGYTVRAEDEIDENMEADGVSATWRLPTPRRCVPTVNEPAFPWKRSPKSRAWRESVVQSSPWGMAHRAPMGRQECP